MIRRTLQIIERKLLRRSVILLLSFGFFWYAQFVSFAQLELENSIPWGESERLTFSVFDEVGGKRVGGAVFEIEAESEENRQLWTIQIEVLLKQSAVTIIQVDRDSFLPVSSYYKSEVLGEIEASYQDDGVSVERRMTGNSKEIRGGNSTYDLYQSCYLMRMFPIEVGYQKKVFVTNSKRPIEQSPAVMRIEEIETIRLSNGQLVRCYRVDAKIDEIRSSFWISADSNRWIYRIVDDSGLTLELDQNSRGIFQSQSFDYQLVLPEKWTGFVHEKKLAPGREQVSFMAPGLSVDFTLTRYQKVGSYDAILSGSQRWLKKHRKHFKVLPESEHILPSDSCSGAYFSGKYLEDGRWKFLFNAVVEVGDNMLIFTGVSNEDDFEMNLNDMVAIVTSARLTTGASQ